MRLVGGNANRMLIGRLCGMAVPDANRVLFSGMVVWDTNNGVGWWSGMLVMGWDGGLGY